MTLAPGGASTRCLVAVVGGKASVMVVASRWAWTCAAAVAAMLEFCEQNYEFNKMLEEHTDAMVEELGLLEEEPPEIKPKAKVTGKRGNVITLDFNTKCEGEG